MGKKKSFIDRKTATTFRVVHRSQRDPLIADNEVGEHVLQPVSTKDLEQRTKYGIYYTDNYDYLQHLKTVGEAVDMEGEIDRTIIKAPNPTRNLPSVIFETQGIELKVGMLNKAAPSNELLPDVDPDIAAALEGNFLEDSESCDGFEDDFIQQLNAEDDGSLPAPVISTLKDEKAGKSEVMRRFGLTREKKFSDDSSNDEEDEDEEGEDEQGSDVDMDDVASNDHRSRFTNYSMSSAMIKRPDGLQIIDEHFETLYEQYDDEQCGEIEDQAEHISGHIDPSDERFQQLVRDHALNKRFFVPEKPTDEMKELALKYAAKEADETVSDSDSESEDDNQTRKRRWDCESILSTYSNTQNHPMVIKDTGSTKRRRRDKDVKTILEEMDDTESVYTTVTTASTVRPRGETAEERRVRKLAAREQRRARRVEKSTNKRAFKEQKKDFDRQRATVHVDTRPIR